MKPAHSPVTGFLLQLMEGLNITCYHQYSPPSQFYSSFAFPQWYHSFSDFDSNLFIAWSIPWLTHI